MFKRVALFGALFGALSIGLAACGGDESPTPRPTATQRPAAAEPTAKSAPVGSIGADVIEVVNRDLGGSGKYEFDPAEFSFKVGESVTFRLTAETEFHTFTSDDLGFDQEVDAGESVDFAITFDKAGTFKLFCVPHQALGMVGTITVE